MFLLIWRRRPCNCDNLRFNLVGDLLNVLQTHLENIITVVLGKKLHCHTRDQISGCIIPYILLWLWSLRTTIKSLFSFTQSPSRGMFWLASDNVNCSVLGLHLNHIISKLHHCRSQMCAAPLGYSTCISHLQWSRKHIEGSLCVAPCAFFCPVRPREDYPIVNFLREDDEKWKMIN